MSVKISLGTLFSRFLASVSHGIQFVGYVSIYIIHLSLPSDFIVEIAHFMNLQCLTVLDEIDE